MNNEFLEVIYIHISQYFKLMRKEKFKYNQIMLYHILLKLFLITILAFN